MKDRSHLRIWVFKSSVDLRDHGFLCTILFTKDTGVIFQMPTTINAMDQRESIDIKVKTINQNVLPTCQRLLELS